MTGRRSHPRFAVGSSWTGALRVLREVVIDRFEHEELVAVSQMPGAIGEEMSLDVVGPGGSFTIKVRVLECRPVVIAGSMRHQLRLSVMTNAESGQPDESQPLALKAVKAL